MLETWSGWSGSIKNLKWLKWVTEKPLQLIFEFYISISIIWTKKILKIQLFERPTSTTSALRDTFWYHCNYFLSSTYQYQLFGARKFWKFNFLEDPLQPHRHLEPHFGTTSTIFWVLHININYLEQENFENSSFWKTHFNHIGT